VNIHDAATVTDLTARDARRRTRIAVAVYAICLVALLALGSYLAPAGTVEAADGDVGESSLQSR
jgi:hypothetical protein